MLNLDSFFFLGGGGDSFVHDHTFDRSLSETLINQNHNIHLSENVCFTQKLKTKYSFSFSRNYFILKRFSEIK